MGRPKGSKNKPKIVLTCGNKNPGKINPENNFKINSTNNLEINSKNNSMDNLNILNDEENNKAIISNPTLSSLQSTPKETGIGLLNFGEKLKKITKTYSQCERCGDEIYCEPRRVDFNILTGVADYYRATPRYLKLCNKCCMELSQIIDNWLLEGKCGEEIKKKWW